MTKTLMHVTNLHPGPKFGKQSQAGELDAKKWFNRRSVYYRNTDSETFCTDLFDRLVALGCLGIRVRKSNPKVVGGIECYEITMEKALKHVVRDVVTDYSLQHQIKMRYFTPRG